jgi:hypothetical protein
VIIIIHIINKIASLKDDNPMIIISNYYEINYLSISSIPEIFLSDHEFLHEAWLMI